MAVYFHDRRTGQVHVLSGQTWGTPRDEETGEALGATPAGLEVARDRAHSGTINQVNDVMDTNAARMNARDVSEGYEVQGTVKNQQAMAKTPYGENINSVADGEFVAVDNGSSIRMLDKPIRTSYGFSEGVLKEKADKLERDAQAQGK
jgi:hypothetical protein